MNAKTILNGAALLVGMAGIFFKSQWWAGADLLMLVGFGLLLVSAAAFTARDNSAAGTPNWLNALMVATLVLGTLGLLFKALHWRGGALLSMGTGGLLLVLSLAMLLARTFAVSRQFVTVFAIWFTLIAAWLNVSAGRGAAATPVAMQEASAAPQ